MTCVYPGGGRALLPVGVRRVTDPQEKMMACEGGLLVMNTLNLQFPVLQRCTVASRDSAVQKQC